MMPTRSETDFVLADVFGARPFSGNSLAVFPDATGLDADQRQAITQEMRHFESVFLSGTDTSTRYRAHIHTMQEELDFAGHPLIGAAAALHSKKAALDERATWTFELNRKSITVSTELRDAGWWADMAQGRPEFLGHVTPSAANELLAALNSESDDLHEGLPVEVVSVGLPYVIVPLRSGLDRARIVHRDFSTLLKTMGAQFAYVFDVDASEGRTWDNDGIVEDVATGSAAGPVGAYLAKHGRLRSNETLALNQGRFAGRPSALFVRTSGSGSRIDNVTVSGNVFIIGTGSLHVLPESDRSLTC